MQHSYYILQRSFQSLIILVGGLFFAISAPNAFAAATCDVTPAASNVVNVMDTGAIGNGIADDTAAIQTAIDQVGGTGGTVLVPAGTYMIDALTSLNMRSDMTFRMSTGAILQTITNSSDSSNVILMESISRINVVGGVIQGERSTHIGTTGESGMGLTIYDSHDVLVRCVTSQNHWGDGFYMGKSSGPINSGITFDGVVSDNNRRQGLSIVIGDGVVVQNSIFKNTNGTLPMSGIDVEPEPGYLINNVQIIDNEMFGNQESGLQVGVPSADGPNPATLTNVTISRNNIHHNGILGAFSYGVYLSKISGVVVTDNSIHDNLRSAIAVLWTPVDSTATTVISGNDIYNNGVIGGAWAASKWAYGIYMKAALRTNVHDNNIHDNIQSGININDLSSENTVTNNEITDNGNTTDDDDYGVVIEGGSTGNTVTNNTIADTRATNLLDAVGGNVTSGNFFVHAPVIGTPSVQSESSIRWSFTDRARDEVGFTLQDASSGTLASSANTNLTYLDESGLAANTQYTGRRVIAYNGTGNSQVSAAAASVYTLAPTPTNFTGTAGQTTMDLSVAVLNNSSSGLSGYYFSRTGANSGWVHTNNWQDTGLTCGTTYTYAVMYRNGDGITTASVPLSMTTSDCSPIVVAPVTPPTSVAPVVASNIVAAAIAITDTATSSSNQNTSSQTKKKKHIKTSIVKKIGERMAPWLRLVSPTPGKKHSKRIQIHAEASDKSGIQAIIASVNGIKKKRSNTSSLFYSYSNKKLARKNITVLIEAYDTLGNVRHALVSILKGKPQTVKYY